MTVATMMKRINTMRKDCARYEKEIARYRKELKETEEEYKRDPRINIERVREDTRKWISYYYNLIQKTEAKIAEASKEAAKLATEEEQKAMIKAMADDMAARGFAKDGYTTKGLRYRIDGNCGWTDRSAHCFTMYIEGRGMVFTSGTLETVAAYILQN